VKITECSSFQGRDTLSDSTKLLFAFSEVSTNLYKLWKLDQVSENLNE
jgi:hypothetical protein